MMLETRPSRFDKIAVVLIALAAAALLITAGGWTLGLRSWWAFSFLVYVPVGLRWLAAALVVVAALPPLYGWWAPLGKLWCPPWLAVLIALPLFWFLREHTWHGDALYKVALLSTETLQSDPYVWKEPLDSFFEHLLAAAVRPIGLQPDSAVALMSVVAGGLYVAAVWVVSAWLAEQGARRFVYRVGLLATGASLLWFGHVENYSWSTALAFTTVVLGTGVLQGRAPLWLAGLVAGVAVSFHPQSAFVAPALLLLVRGRQWPRQLLALVAAGSVVPVATVLLFWGLGIPSPLLAGQGFAGDSQLFWTPAQALAPGQVAQALQNLWLIAPLWPMAIAIGFWRWSQPAARQEPILRFLTVAAAAFLFYHFAFQNDLSRQRDWDLFAVVGPPVTLWGLYAWLGAVDNVPAASTSRTLRQILATGLAFATLYAVCWIGVNYAFTLVRPNPDERELYARYRLLDLTELVSTAAVTPDTPICAEAEGCERVALTEFTMPQSGDHRPTIFAHAPATIAFSLTVPEDRTFLWLSPALDPQAWEWGGDGVTFAVRVRAGEGEQTLWERHITPLEPAHRDWQQAFVPLDDYRGQAIELLFITDPGPDHNDAADRAGWGMPWLMRGTVDVTRIEH